MAVVLAVALLVMLLAACSAGWDAWHNRKGRDNDRI